MRRRRASPGPALSRSGRWSPERTRSPRRRSSGGSTRRGGSSLSSRARACSTTQRRWSPTGPRWRRSPLPRRAGRRPRSPAIRLGAFDFVVAAVGGIAVGLAVGCLRSSSIDGCTTRRSRSRLAGHPVRGIPAGRAAGAVRRAGRGVGGTGHRRAAGDDHRRRHARPVAVDLEDGHFLLNGFLFVLIGLELPQILARPGRRRWAGAGGRDLLVVFAVIGAGSSISCRRASLPNGPLAQIAGFNPVARATADDRVQLGGVAWGGLARGGARAAARLPGAQPDPAADLLGDPRHAGGPGADPAVPRSLGRVGRGRARRRRAERSPAPRPTRPASPRSLARGGSGPGTCRCSIGWSPASATARTTSPRRTQARPRSGARNAPSTRRSSATSSPPSAAVIELRDRRAINDERCG